jgi:hypothetical protein
VLSNVFSIEGRYDLSPLGYAVDLAEQVLDDIFQLTLTFDHGRHALQVFGVANAFQQDNGMRLRDVVEPETLRSLSLDADLVEVD